MTAIGGRILKFEGPIETLEDLRVLVVEDNVQTMGLVRSMLSDIGVHQVFTAEDGRQALEFIADGEEMINVIVSDWKLPRVTGIELLREVRAVDSDIPFLMVTGSSDMTSVKVAMENGVTAYLAKPFSTDQLQKKVILALRILRVKQRAE